MSNYCYYLSPSDYDIALANGINYNALNSRVRNLAWPKEKAITTPLRQKGKMSELAKIAEANGIPYMTMAKRIRRGWEPERAATQQILTPAETLARARSNKRRNRNYPREVVELAAENGIAYTTFIRRMQRGWTLEKASETKVMTKVESGRRGAEESYWSKGPRVLRKG